MREKGDKFILIRARGLMGGGLKVLKTFWGPDRKRPVKAESEGEEDHSSHPQGQFEITRGG